MGLHASAPTCHRPAIGDWHVGIAVASVWLAGCAALAWAEGEKLIGTPAPEWTVRQWVQSEPLTLSQLRGSVILIRFWTDACPFCSEAAGVLSRLHERYAREGLVVIGIYHPKPPRRIDPAFVKRTAKALGMDFPIGLDPDWAMLKQYWWDSQPQRSWTSVSFLIDQRGIIRYLHPGGSYSPQEAEALEAEIVRWLARSA